jgi:copper chaperone
MWITQCQPELPEICFLEKTQFMKTEHIAVDNLKCNGCAHTIEKNLLKEESVSKVLIDIKTGELDIEGSDSLDREALIEKLSHLGYPERGTSNFRHKATSYVSCMVGRINN